MNARALKKEQIYHLADSSDSKVNLSDWAERLTEHQHQMKEKQIKKGKLLRIFLNCSILGKQYLNEIIS